MKGKDGEGVESDEEGILPLRNCLEDETSSLNGLFHWQMRDYKAFQPKCNMLQIKEKESQKGDRGCLKEHGKRIAEVETNEAIKLSNNLLKDIVKSKLKGYRERNQDVKTIVKPKD